MFLNVRVLCPIGKILDLIRIVERHFLFIANSNRPLGFDNRVQRLLSKANVASNFFLASQTGEFLFSVEFLAFFSQFVTKYLSLHRAGI